MDYCTASSQQTRSRKSNLPWVACGAACAIGVWGAFTISGASTAAHVSVQRSVNMRAPMMSVARSSGSQLVRPEIRSQTLTNAHDSSVDSSVGTAVYESNFQQVAAYAGACALFLGAAFTVARRLLSPVPEAVGLMSVSSEKDGSIQKMRDIVDKMDAADMKVLARGAMMEEVAKSKGIDEVAAAIRADQLSRKDLSPKDVILEMQRGNGRFWMGLSERPDMDALQRRALILAQAPKICVLSCSDSRVPVEIIFDQGLGEIFVVRMAGNILDANAHGSIEYAVKYLGVKVIMVIGHEGCGAVKGAIGMSPEDIAKEPEDLQVVLKSIKSKLNVEELNQITDGRSRDREAIVLNTSNQVKQLQANKVFAEKIADGSLLVCGAFYEISSGVVDFFSLDKNGFVVDM